MKYSFEEKKKWICITAVILFAVIAGIVYFVSYGKSDKEDFITAEAVNDTNEPGNNSGMGLSESSESKSNASDDSKSKENNVDAYNPQKVIVHVCGAVAAPGMYEISGNMRIADAVTAAGGFLDSAASDYLNLAQVLHDGEKLVVYTKKEVKKLIKDGKLENNNDLSNSQSSKKDTVNINTASAEELMTLPGIGQSKADAIIEYRSKNGSFSDKEELMSIPGIKEGVFSKIADNIVVN